MRREDSLVARELVGGPLPQSREIREVYKLRCKGWIRVKAAEKWRASVTSAEEMEAQIPRREGKISTSRTFIKMVSYGYSVELASITLAPEHQ